MQREVYRSSQNGSDVPNILYLPHIVRRLVSIDRQSGKLSSLKP